MSGSSSNDKELSLSKDTEPGLDSVSSLHISTPVSDSKDSDKDISKTDDLDAEFKMTPEQVKEDNEKTKKIFMDAIDLMLNQKRTGIRRLKARERAKNVHSGPSQAPEASDDGDRTTIRDLKDEMEDLNLLKKFIWDKRIESYILFQKCFSDNPAVEDMLDQLIGVLGHDVRNVEDLDRVLNLMITYIEGKEVDPTQEKKKEKCIKTLKQFMEDYKAMMKDEAPVTNQIGFISINEVTGSYPELFILVNMILGFISRDIEFDDVSDSAPSGPVPQAGLKERPTDGRLT